jgi:hypothetical protein
MAVLTAGQWAMKPTVRRLANQGWSAAAIARRYRGMLTPGQVRTILASPVRRPSPVGPARPIWSRLATRVRRLHFDEGKTAAEVAVELDLDPARVEDFLSRLAPRQAHHRRAGATLNRPRSRREQDNLREWLPRRHGDDGRDHLMLPGLDLVVELPEPLRDRPLAIVPPIPAPTVWEGGPMSPHATRERGPSRRKTKRLPDDHAAVKLDSAKRDEIRRLAKEGWGCRRLARRFGVGLTAIHYVLRGPHRDEPHVPAMTTKPIGRLDPRTDTATSRGPQAGADKLSPEDRDEIRRLAGEGWGCRRLGKRFGVNRGTIASLLKGKSWQTDPGAATPPPPKPKPGSWREPKGTDRRRR